MQVGSVPAMPGTASLFLARSSSITEPGHASIDGDKRTPLRLHHILLQPSAWIILHCWKNTRWLPPIPSDAEMLDIVAIATTGVFDHLPCACLCGNNGRGLNPGNYVFVNLFYFLIELCDLWCSSLTLITKKDVVKICF